MLKRFGQSVVRLFVLGLLLLQLLWGSQTAMAQDSPPSKAPPPEKVEEVFSLPSDQHPAQEPPIKSESKQKSTATRTQKSYPQPPQEYNRKALERFDLELYGD